MNATNIVSENGPTSSSSTLSTGYGSRNNVSNGSGRGRGKRWMLAAGLAALILLGLICARLDAERISTTLQTNVNERLEMAGVSGVIAQADGRHITLLGDVADQKTQRLAIATADQEDGVTVVKDQLNIASASLPRTAKIQLDANQIVTVTGDIGSETDRDTLLDTLKTAALSDPLRPLTIVDELQVVDDTPAWWTNALTAGASRLDAFSTADITLREDKLMIEGQVDSALTANKVVAAVAGTAPASVKPQFNIIAPAPSVPSPTDESGQNLSGQDAQDSTQPSTQDESQSDDEIVVVSVNDDPLPTDNTPAPTPVIVGIPSEIAEPNVSEQPVSSQPSIGDPINDDQTNANQLTNEPTNGESINIESTGIESQTPVTQPLVVNETVPNEDSTADDASVESNEPTININTASVTDQEPTPVTAPPATPAVTGTLTIPTDDIVATSSDTLVNSSELANPTSVTDDDLKPLFTSPDSNSAPTSSTANGNIGTDQSSQSSPSGVPSLTARLEAIAASEGTDDETNIDRSPKQVLQIAAPTQSNNDTSIPNANFMTRYTFDGDRVFLEGIAPDEKSSDWLIATASRHTQANNISNDMIVTNTEIPGWRNIMSALDTGMNYYSHATATLSPGFIGIIGQAKDEATRDAAQSKVSGMLPAGYDVSFSVGVQDQRATSTLLSQSGIQCQTQLNEVGDTQSMWFQTGSHNLSSQGEVAVQRVAQILSGCESSGITIAGWADPRGPEDYNLRLSERRAQSVSDWLTQNGINQSRLFPVGRGETFEIGTNDANFMQRSRRVEFIVRN